MKIDIQNSVDNLKILLILFSVALITACSTQEQSDAYGQFEATEVTISSEITGKLIEYRVQEGQQLIPDQSVGIVDTTELHLQRMELGAQIEATNARIANIDAEIAVVQEELTLARSNLNRISSMAEDGAATQQQLDDANSRVATIEKRIFALQTQKQSIRAEIRSLEVRIEQIAEQIRDAIVVNPLQGIVLTNFVEQNELVGQGQALYTIANLDTLTLRVFISGSQLPAVRLNQPVEVLIDRNAEENQLLNGMVNWIASEAEFTPRMIQTKEERVNQVYAVKVRVPNSDGILKIGMPGEVNF